MFQGSLGELTEQDEYATLVDAPDRAALTTALTNAGLAFELLRTGLTVKGADTAAVGAIAAAAGVALSSLQRRGPALEEVFLDLVNGVRVHESAHELADPEADGEAGAEVPATDEPELPDDEAEPEVPDVEVPLPAATWDAGHPTTEADIEADRFFSRFDASEGEPASEAESASGSEPAPEPESDGEADAEPPAADGDGGEQR